MVTFLIPNVTFVDISRRMNSVIRVNLANQRRNERTVSPCAPLQEMPGEPGMGWATRDTAAL